MGLATEFPGEGWQGSPSAALPLPCRCPAAAPPLPRHPCCCPPRALHTLGEFEKERDEMHRSHRQGRVGRLKMQDLRRAFRKSY